MQRPVQPTTSVIRYLLGSVCDLTGACWSVSRLHYRLDAHGGTRLWLQWRGRLAKKLYSCASYAWKCRPISSQLCRTGTEWGWGPTTVVYHNIDISDAAGPIRTWCRHGDRPSNYLSSMLVWSFETPNTHVLVSGIKGRQQKIEQQQCRQVTVSQWRTECQTKPFIGVSSFVVFICG